MVICGVVSTPESMLLWRNNDTLDSFDPFDLFLCAVVVFRLGRSEGLHSNDGGALLGRQLFKDLLRGEGCI